MNAKPVGGNANGLGQVGIDSGASEPRGMVQQRCRQRGFSVFRKSATRGGRASSGMRKRGAAAVRASHRRSGAVGGTQPFAKADTEEARNGILRGHGPGRAVLQTVLSLADIGLGFEPCAVAIDKRTGDDTNTSRSPNRFR